MDNQNSSDPRAEVILKRAITRVAHVLTKEDLKTLDTLEKEDTTGNAIKYFLLSKAPNLYEIIKEEAQEHRQES